MNQLIKNTEKEMEKARTVKSNWEIDLDAFYYPDHNIELTWIVRTIEPGSIKEQRLVHENELDDYVGGSK